jgi:hypothetical protein
MPSDKVERKIINMMNRKVPTNAEQSYSYVPDHYGGRYSTNGYKYYVNHQLQTTSRTYPLRPQRYDIHHDEEGRLYYEDHELKIISYLNPVTKEEMKRNGFTGHDARAN